MTAAFDAIVIGLGAMGSAAVYQLARRGVKILGIDAFSPPHDLGSTHGHTRITRLAIGEGEQYVPLVKRSHELWHEIERETGAELLTHTGGLIIGTDAAQRTHGASHFLRGTINAAQRHGIPHEILKAPEIRRRFPTFAVRDDEYGYFEPEAGLVRPEACVKAQLNLAERHNAVLHRNERVTAIDANGGGIRVTTDRGVYQASRAILTVGPWINEFLPPDHRPFFKVYREVLYWFAVTGSIDPYLPNNFPIFIRTSHHDADILYGFPAIDGPTGGIKVASEQFDITTSPDAPQASASAAETAQMQARVAELLPGATGTCLKAVTCLYTCTPDFAFVIDELPAQPRVIVASPCSGHGFKHSAAIGEALAQWVVDGQSAIDLSAFRWSRFPTPGI